MNHSLEKRPKVFDGVRVNFAFNVSDHVINEGVFVFGDTAIRAKRIGVELRSSLHVSAKVRKQRRSLVISDDHRANLAGLPALNHSEHSRFARGRSVREADESALGHATLNATADESFVCFNLALKHDRRIVFHGFADTMEHKPRRLLRNTKRTTKLMRGRSVFRICQEPNRGKPLAKRDRGVLKYRTDLDRELPLTLLTAPQFARFDELHGSGPATLTRAGYAMRPAQFYGPIERPFGVRKVGHGFQESGRRFHGFIVGQQGANCMALGASDISA
ncbi:MAG TPA: hypothetical protein VFW34_10830 [Candidatus Rubrimentiphilum sp.]|nr:hypothetical protein [Candidatus Rubrimentiphilum sp.]